jgi:hypothetical protein
MACQSSGRRSRRVTSPPVARSIATQRSTGVTRGPVDHCDINTGETPMRVANNRPLPNSSCNQSFNFMAKLLAMREHKAIATREFLFFANRYPIGSMKTISEIRRENLLLLIGEHESIAKLNIKVGLTRTDATLSQIKNRSADSKTGVAKAMGDSVARRIENALSLEVGWMDNQQVPHTYRNSKLAAAMSVMEAMDDHQLSQVTRIIHTFAEPEKNGTT